MVKWKFAVGGTLPLVFGYYRVLGAVDTLRSIKAADEDYFIKVTTFKIFESADHAKLISKRLKELIVKDEKFLAKIVDDAYSAWDSLLKVSQEIKKTKPTSNNFMKLLEKYRDAISNTRYCYGVFDINDALLGFLRENLKRISESDFDVLTMPIDSEPAQSLHEALHLILQNKKREALEKFGWLPGLKQMLSEPVEHIKNICSKMKCAAELNTKLQDKIMEKVEPKFKSKINLMRKIIYWINWNDATTMQAEFNLNPLYKFISKQIKLKNDDLSYVKNKINWLLPEEVEAVFNGKLSLSKLNKALDFRMNKGYTCIRDEKGFRFVGGLND
jgi:hypothetical protein